MKPTTNDAREPGSLHRMVRRHVSITVRGYSGVGWELQCVGPRRWAERTLERFIPEVQRASLVPPNDKLSDGGPKTL